MALATDGFIFDLGTIDVSENLTTTPTFDVTAAVEIEGDVLLQYEWSRIQMTGEDPTHGGGAGVGATTGKQGDWFNCFLFNVDASDISNTDSDDIKYHTVKANWCGHSITRANYDRWGKPGVWADTSEPASGDADASGADASGGTKGDVQFSATTGGVAGNFNAPQTSNVGNYMHGSGVTTNLDYVSDASTHLNLAGEYMRYYSAQLFGGRLRYGLDIFSNDEYELMEEVRAKDVPLNTAVQAHLTTSNTLGTSLTENRKTNVNIPHVLLSQLLADPQGALRVQNTLSKPAFANIADDVAYDDISGNNYAPSRNGGC